MSGAPLRQWARQTGVGVAIVVAYVALAALGAEFAVLDSLTVWYPPVGLAMAVTALGGSRHYFALALGEILVALLFGVADELGWLVVPNGLLYALVYTVGGRATARLGGTAPTVSWRRPLGIVGVGVVAAPAAGAVVGVGMQWLGGVVAASEVPRSLLVWALGDAVGAASVGVTLVTIAVRARRGGRWWALPDLPSVVSVAALLLPAAALATIAPLGDGGVVPFTVAVLVPYLALSVIGGVPAAGLAAFPTSLAMTVVARDLYAQELLGRTDLQVLQLVVIVTGVFVAMVVEERRELALLLTESERHLRQSQIQSRSGSFRWDVHDGQVHWSSGLFHLLGLQEQPTDDETYLRRVHPDDRDVVRRRLRHAVRTGEPYHAQHRVRTADGRDRVMRVVVTPRSFDGRVTELTGTITDVTADQRSRERLAAALEREQAAAAREREARELEAEAAARSRHAERVKEALLVAVSHEIRTPLTVVRGVAETLGRPEILAELGPHGIMVERLERHSRRLQRVLGDLLDVDRIARGVVRPNRRPVDIGALIEDVVDHVRVDEDRLTVVVDDAVRSFPVDSAITARIVEHLLLNASRHAPSSPIEVHAACADDDLALEVADRGPGIPEDARERLFEPFEAGLDGGANPGTGIGLYLVDQFTALQGGHVSVTARDGGGTSVTVVLPRELDAIPG